ncbi:MULTISPECIES: GNAT family N-acetyltransferase [Mycobacteriaceae]|uniref:GNAT family N-acetyltransferase n=1 Tax=Mycolicibacterium mucogenicum DSM 44124 TaxID=1226753 RepID=A0A8H2JHV1_MYCMU|nr:MULTISPECIES: GNAT family N-acetyltransferase [Mycobacteriaceae]QPG67095.1 GNAT family N-acetyltransferase [Mycolicibacterium mucogenicum DSM 44124]
MPVNIREAVAADAMAVAEAHVRSWQIGYRGLLPAPYLDALRPEDRASRYSFEQMNPEGPFTQVAIDGDTICGHVTTGRCRDDDLQGGGEIWAIYVDPHNWGCGIGHRLITAGCAHLRSRGYNMASLWVLSANDRARHFYESAGWYYDGTQRTDSIGDHLVDEVRYQRSLHITD